MSDQPRRPRISDYPVPQVIPITPTLPKTPTLNPTEYPDELEQFWVRIQRRPN